MLCDLDADGNGTICFDEWFFLMTCKICDQNTRANLYKIFVIYDDQRTGYLTVSNLRRVANDIGEVVSDA